MVTEIAKKPFNFYLPEKINAAEDTAYPQSLPAMQLKLTKKIKAGVLDELVDDMPDNFKSLPPVKQKKYVDSAEIVFRKKVAASYKRRINSILQNPYGLTQYMGNIYCETIASCFDPHTQFLLQKKKKNLKARWGSSLLCLALRLNPTKNGGAIIDKLEPGSPAFKGRQTKQRR